MPYPESQSIFVGQLAWLPGQAPDSPQAHPPDPLLCLQIRGTDKGNVRELHIAYRYGEHYDSVRRINDNSEAPAHLQTDFQMLHQDGTSKKEKIKTKRVDFEDGLRDEVEDAVQKVVNATGCSDFNLIVQNLEAENYNIESAVIAVLQMNQGKRNNEVENLEPDDQVKQCGPSCEEAGSGSKLFGNQGGNEGRTENSKARASPSEENKATRSQLPKVTNKQRREQQRLEKKKRQEERHRHKALENRNSHRDASRSEAEVNTQVTLVKTFAALNI